MKIDDLKSIMKSDYNELYTKSIKNTVFFEKLFNESSSAINDAHFYNRMKVKIRQ